MVMWGENWRDDEIGREREKEETYHITSETNFMIASLRTPMLCTTFCPSSPSLPRVIANATVKTIIPRMFMPLLVPSLTMCTFLVELLQSMAFSSI